MPHWRKIKNPKYLGSYDLPEGQDLIVTIKTVDSEMVSNTEGDTKSEPILHFVENYKPMVCNSTNCKAIAKIYKSPLTENWEGKKIQLFVMNKKVFGELTDVIRIRPFLPKAAQPAKIEKCHDCGKDIVACGGMTSEQVAQYAKSKYKVAVCVKCGVKRKNTEQNQAAQPPESEVVQNDTTQS